MSPLKSHSHKPTSSSFLAFLIAAFVISHHFPLFSVRFSDRNLKCLWREERKKISMGCEPTSTHHEDHIIDDILGESTLHKHTELSVQQVKRKANIISTLYVEWNAIWRLAYSLLIKQRQSVEYRRHIFLTAHCCSAQHRTSAKCKLIVYVHFIKLRWKFMVKCTECGLVER